MTAARTGRRGQLDGWTNPLRDARDKRLPRIAGPCGLVIFGVTGDLSRKKLMPAIYDLANRGLLPPGFALVGFARRDWAAEDFGQVVHDAVREHARTPFRQEVWDRLAEGFRFVQGSFDDDEAFDRLENDRRTTSTGSAAPAATTRSTCRSRRRVPGGAASSSPGPGLSAQDGDQWRRVVIEKPFGHDLKSAIELNEIVNDVFPEESVFRIDHYLGKETVQNILALRFANQLFEPIWNSHYVDHVQITMAEDIGLGGRAGYYDGIGAARDVIQNHLLQLLAFTAMEEPTSFSARRAARREDQGPQRDPAGRTRSTETTARGQYTGGWQGGELVRGLKEEEGFDPELQHRDLRGHHLRGRDPPLGRACRSTCAPASGWAAGSPRSPWCSSGPRTCRSTRR